MRFVHYSNVPIVQLFDRGQSKEYTLKPMGLWVSDEDDYGWSEWCKYNAPGYLGKLSYNVTFEEDANILWLKTPKEIKAFGKKWGRTGEPWDKLSKEFCRPIAWEKVAEVYDGIIITPIHSIWDNDLGGVTWYYGWDCASGCIWNKKAIKSLTPA